MASLLKEKEEMDTRFNILLFTYSSINIIYSQIWFVFNRFWIKFVGRLSAFLLISVLRIAIIWNDNK